MAVDTLKRKTLAEKEAEEVAAKSWASRASDYDVVKEAGKVAAKEWASSASKYDVVKDAMKVAERASHIARIKEGFRGLGTGGVVGARMAGQAVTSAGRNVVMPVVVNAGAKAREAGARAAESTKQYIHPAFIFVAVLGHVFDAFTGFRVTQFRILLYMSLGVWALFIFKNASKKVLMLVTGIFAWMFFAPYLLSFPGISSTGFYNFLSMIIVTFPLLPIASIYLLGEVKDSKFLQRLQIAFLFVVVFLMFPAITTYAASAGLPDAQIDVRAAYTEAGGHFANSMNSIAKATSLIGSEMWNNLISQATGEQYPSKTADNTPLGIFITDISVDSPDEVAYAGEPVTILASITASTLKEPIPIKEVKCKEGSSDSWINGEIIRRGEVTDIYNNEILDVKCVFGEEKGTETGSAEITTAAVYGGGGLKSGSRTITVAVSYEFTGSATMTTIFMDRNQKRAIEQSGEDPLAKLFPGFPKNPVAVNARNGPVDIGMQFGEKSVDAPIGILTEENILFKLSFANRKNWNGKIEKIKSLVVKLPPEFERDPEFCPFFEPGSLILDTETSLANMPKEGISNAVSFRCSLKIKENLQKSINSFTATAEYVYRTEATKSITVKMREGETAGNDGGAEPSGGGGVVVPIIAPEEVKGKIIQAANVENVPFDYALAIAYVESGLSHTRPDGSVKIGSEDIGIMQINPPTGLGSCKDLGVNSISDLYDIDKNIKCGVRIMRNKCNAYKCETNSKGVYYPCNRKTYYGWDIAARGYNGWACGTDAQNRYVETVNEARKRLTQNG